MITFEKKIDKMLMSELRAELGCTRKIIDDIYELTTDAIQVQTVNGKQNIINQIARYCYRGMPT